MIDMIDRLADCLKLQGVNQKDLAARAKVTPGMINGLLKRRYSASDRTISAICDALGIREAWLRTGEEPMVQETPRTIIDELARQYSLTPDAVQILRIIAQAFERMPAKQAHEMVEIARRELMRPEDQPAPETEPEPEEMITIRLYTMPSAAGAPIDGGDEYVNREFPRSAVPVGADYAVTISGQSMEPTIHDRQTVFVHQTPSAQDGEIVIAWIDGEGLVCKRARVENDQLVALESDNPEYPGITGDRLTGARVYARVLGYPVIPRAPKSPGETIHAARLALNLSHEDIARAIAHETGEFVSSAHVLAWEQDKRRVPRAYREILARVLNLGK